MGSARGWVAGGGAVCGAGVASGVAAVCCVEAPDWLESEGVLFAAPDWVLGWEKDWAPDWGALASASASVEDAAWAAKWIGRLFSGGAEV